MKDTNRISATIIEEYASGVPVSEIASFSKMTTEEVLAFLREYKKSCTVSNTFTNEFKMMIAERDVSENVTRSSIALELKINPTTVKKACEKFGSALKDKIQSDEEFTRIDGNFTMDECPTCKSKKVNKVETDSIYCKDCGDEHIFKEEGYILKVNFEYID